MCGICGVVGEDLSRDTRRGIIARMSAQMLHRGPDDGGELHLGNASLGHRRLSIIDPSADGHQPIANEDESVWLVANGEIYNFKDLRHTLNAKGHAFRSRTDTEMILHLYEEHGTGVTRELRGMFAFALVDQRRRQLLLARDRLGIKPVYYYQTPSKFVFASEIRALLASGLVPRQLNLAALDHYTAFGYVPPPETLIEGVRALLPGHQLLLREGTMRIERYWEIPTPDERPLEPGRVLPELRALLEETVALHCQSDVPLGAFLSGGIDSTAIVALMAQRGAQRVRTFSVGFDAGPPRLNELAFARRTAERLGTAHSEIVVSGAEIAHDIDRFIAAIDQPSFDGINTFLVAQAARRGGLTVALSGLGGDEVFGGYNIFRIIDRGWRWVRAWSQLPPRLRARLAAAAAGLLPNRQRGEKARRFGQVDSLADFYAAIRLNLWTNERAALYADGVAERMRRWPGYREPLELLADLCPQPMGAWQTVSRLEMQNYMNWRLLRDTDAMSMTHSLEVRVPFVDHEVIEYVSRLPVGWQRRWGFPKRLLTAALGDLMPADVLARPKQGFQFPIGTWMGSALRPVVEDALSPTSVRRRGLFAPEPLARLYRRFQEGRYPYEVVWQFVVLELWLRQVLDA